MLSMFGSSDCATCRQEQRKRLAAISCQSGSKCTVQTTGCQLINTAALQHHEKSRLLLATMG